ncbi:hypothetical protein [Sporomusa sp. KB1]|uniref:hypothetical protein n=1 Tax=Sporomusa sp. KB1 TaxID=943346 RepID=UPI0011A20C67|nr:hypothetical protein [Sporomusa sp. KB1]TWH51712.1 hypothetical protein Salpa_0169 [Sporomusa sp. KB1]
MWSIEPRNRKQPGAIDYISPSGHFCVYGAGRARPRQETNGGYRLVRRVAAVGPVERLVATVLCFHPRRSASRPVGSAGGVSAGLAGVSCRGPAQRAGPAAGGNYFFIL